MRRGYAHALAWWLPVMPASLVAQNAPRAADSALIRLAGDWQVRYRDAQLGEVTGRAVISVDSAGRPVVRYLVQHPTTGTSYELQYVRSSLRGQSLELELTGESPGNALPPRVASTDTLSVPNDVELIARMGEARAARVRVTRRAAPLLRVVFRLADAANGRLDGEWRMTRSPITPTHGVRAGTALPMDRPGAPRTVETLAGPESWTRRGDIADLSVHVIPAELSSRRASIVVENAGPGPADQLRILLGRGSRWGLCSSAPCSPEPIRAWSIQCTATGPSAPCTPCDVKPATTLDQPGRIATSAAACAPCEVAPSAAVDQPGLELKCGESLAPGGRMELTIDLPDRLTPDGTAPQAVQTPRCEMPRAAISAYSASSDPNPANNQGSLFLDRDPEPVDSVWVIATGRAPDSMRVVDRQSIVADFRVLVRTRTALCPDAPVRVSFARADGTQSFSLEARAVPNDSVPAGIQRDGHFAITRPTSILEAYWGKPVDSEFPSLLVSTRSWGDGPVPPVPGDYLTVWAGEHRTRLDIAELQEPFSIELVPLAPSRATRMIRKGEQFRIVAKAPRDSGSSRDHLAVFLVASTATASRTVSHLLTRDGTEWRSELLTVRHESGTRLEARFAHAPFDPDRARLVVGDANPRTVTWLSQETVRRPLESVCFGCSILIEVTDATQSLPDEVSVEVTVERNGRTVYRDTQTAKRSYEGLRTNAFVLAENSQQGLQASDILTATVPALDLVSTIPLRKPRWSSRAIQFVSAARARELANRPSVAPSNVSMKAMSLGRQVGVVFWGGSLETWTSQRPSVMLSIAHIRSGIVREVRSLPISPSAGAQVWSGIIDPRTQFPDLAPGDSIAVVHSSGREREPDLWARVGVERNSGSGPSLSLLVNTEGDQFAPGTSAALSGVVRIALGFAEPPSDTVVTGSLRWVSARGTYRDVSVQLLRDPANPRRYLGTPIGLAGEVTRSGVASGDRMLAMYPGAVPASLTLTGRPGLATRIRFRTPETPLSENDRGLVSIAHNEGVWVETTFEAPPNEPSIRADLTVHPAQGEATRSYWITAERDRTEPTRYIGRIPADWSARVGFWPGKKVTVRYGGVEASAEVRMGEFASGNGRLRLIAQRPSYATEPVRVSVSIKSDGSPMTERTGPAPATFDVPAGRYTATLCYEAGGACYNEPVSVAAGETRTIEIAATDMGRIRFTQDGKAVVAELRRLERASNSRDEWSERWTLPTHIGSRSYIDLPAGRYDVTIARPETNLEADFPTFEVIGGKDEVLSLGATGRLTLRIVDVPGGRFDRIHLDAVETGKEVALTSGDHVLPAGRYEHNTAGVPAPTDVIEVRRDETTIAVVRLGRLLLKGAPGAEALVRSAANRGRYRIKAAEPHPIIAGRYQIEFGSAAGNGRTEVIDVEIAPGQTLEVSQGMVGRSRVNISLPREATGVVDWSISLQGQTRTGAYERRHVAQTDASAVVPTELPPGRFTLKASGISRLSETVQHVLWRQTFEVVAGAIKTVTPPRMGVIEVTVCNQTEVWLLGQAPDFGNSTVAEGRMMRFVVPEADYVLRSNGVPDRLAASRSGQVTRVALECAR